MNILKTMYEKQEKGQEKHEKHIQSLIKSVYTLVSKSRYQREFSPLSNQNQNRYASPLGPVPQRLPWKCYYCFGTDHLFLNCMVKNEDKQKGLILVDGFTVRFANGELISTDPNLSIRECVKKHLLLSVAVMLMSNLDPDLVEFLDRKHDTRYNQNILPKTILKGPQPGPSRKEQQQLEVTQLKNKVKDLEVMLQKLQTDSNPEPEEKDMEGFLRRIVAEYTQLKGLQEKRLDFQKNQGRNHLSRKQFISKTLMFQRVLQRAEKQKL